MKKPRISAIAALNKRDRSIGKNNELIWKIPADLQRFKRLTTGHPIIMGRKTFESIGRALPNRTNIIVTRNPGYKVEGCIVCDSIEAALDIARARDSEEIFIIGGGEIYKAALPFTDRLYLTLVDSAESGDIFFPDYSQFAKVIESEVSATDEPRYEWVTLER